MTDRITVGFDGSDSSSEAVLWSAQEAVARRAPLHIVACWDDMASLAAGAAAFPEAGAVLSSRQAMETVLGRLVGVVEQSPSRPGAHQPRLSPVPRPAVLMDRVSVDGLLVVGASSHHGAGRVLAGEHRSPPGPSRPLPGRGDPGCGESWSAGPRRRRRRRVRSCHEDQGPSSLVPAGLAVARSGRVRWSGQPEHRGPGKGMRRCAPLSSTSPCTATPMSSPITSPKASARASTSTSCRWAGPLRSCSLTATSLVCGGPTHVHGMSSERSRAAAVTAQEKEPGRLSLDPEAAGPGLRDWFQTIPRAVTRRRRRSTRGLDGPAPLTGRASRGIARRLRDHDFRLVVGPESFLVDKQTRLVVGEEAASDGVGSVGRGCRGRRRASRSPLSLGHPGRRVPAEHEGASWARHDVANPRLGR